MAIETVKVTKDFVVKEIKKKDLQQYLAMGWKESKQSPYPNTNVKPLNRI